MSEARLARFGDAEDHEGRDEPPLQGSRAFHANSWGCTPGYHEMGLRPGEQDALMRKSTTGTLLSQLKNG
jgi:hypothetical protein